jgi:DNA (cytosine-5)-methyltransferase 1
VIPFDAVDLFAGPGGWSEGMKQLGMRDLGLELDDAACRTRYAAGHATWQVDVTTVDPCMFRGVPGLIASPPCQDFSTAGGMAGRGGAKGRLVDVVPEWVAKMEPRWVACEQVVGVLPIWQEHAHLYRELGYSVWTGILDAADFGVPQNRLRAILVASIDGVALPPEPTHGGTSLFGELKDRVALADVLGVKPGWVYDSGQNSTTKDGPVRYVRSCDRPAGTLTTKAVTQWVLRSPDGERAKVSRRQALELQTFRPDYPVQGTNEKQDQQIGNAVPPRLAACVVAAVADSYKAVTR